ncbi:hypothetical protein V3C99_015281 [Haemonchus contortus]
MQICKQGLFRQEFKKRICAGIRSVQRPEDVLHTYSGHEAAGSGDGSAQAVDAMVMREVHREGSYPQRHISNENALMLRPEARGVKRIRT